MRSGTSRMKTTRHQGDDGDDGGDEEDLAGRVAVRGAHDGRDHRSGMLLRSSVPRLAGTRGGGDRRAERDETVVRPGSARGWPAPRRGRRRRRRHRAMRKNETAAEAAPMSRTSTVFWTARTRFCIIAPMPRPMTAIETPTLPQRGGVVAAVPGRPGRATRKMPPPTRNAFQRPVRLMIWPATVEESMRRDHQRDGQQAGLGRAVARATWKYWPRNVVPPNIAMPTATLATMTRTAVRLARTFSGTSGSGPDARRRR